MVRKLSTWHVSVLSLSVLCRYVIPLQRKVKLPPPNKYIKFMCAFEESAMGDCEVGLWAFAGRVVIVKQVATASPTQ